MASLPLGGAGGGCPDGFPPPRGSWRGAVRMASLPLGGVGGGLLGINWTAPLDSTSCRRFVIDLAKARRCDGEGSLWFHWGLGISVKSKENASQSDGKIQNTRWKGSTKSKKVPVKFILYSSLAIAELKVLHSSFYILHFKFLSL